MKHWKDKNPTSAEATLGYLCRGACSIIISAVKQDNCCAETRKASVFVLPSGNKILIENKRIIVMDRCNGDK